jgi:flagellar hook-associated protein 2
MASSLAFGTNLDINAIVTQLMTVEQRPLTCSPKRQAKLETKISSLRHGQKRHGHAADCGQALGNAEIFASRKATIADAGVATVAASTTATPGNYSIEVSSLARSQVTASSAFAGGSTATVGSGTLTIELGSYSGGAFTANPDKTAVNVTIGAGASSLADVRDAINAAGAGVTASLLNDGTGTRLVLTSQDGGTANTVRITASDDDGNDTDNAGLSKLIYDASTGGTSTSRREGDRLRRSTQGQWHRCHVEQQHADRHDRRRDADAEKYQCRQPDHTDGGVRLQRCEERGRKAGQELQRCHPDHQEPDNLQHDHPDRCCTQRRKHGAQPALAPVVRRYRRDCTGRDAGQHRVSVQKDGSLKVDSDKLTTALESGGAKTLFMGSTGVTGLASKIDSMIDTSSMTTA